MILQEHVSRQFVPSSFSTGEDDVSIFAIYHIWKKEKLVCNLIIIIIILLQAHTVYVPKKQPFQNITDQLPTEVLGDEELIRVIQYRSGTNTLGIVFFCLVFGTFLGTLGEKGQVVIDFFKAVFEVIMRMVSTVMWWVLRSKSNIKSDMTALYDV